ncbi:hypothetical protein AB0B25_19095 [Nocardia sp. NPDC049190]|uniref:hypothetical protein n=1 Tax=Nocardia sp. NPDC049190 TaxID=3155650 RepID=UPI00340499AC
MDAWPPEATVGAATMDLDSAEDANGVAWAASDLGVAPAGYSPTSLESTWARRDGNRCMGPAPLLEPEQLLAAISGGLSGGSPLIGWARALGDLHAALIPVHLGRPQRPCDFDEPAIHADIARIVGEIDAWAVFPPPRAVGACKHTHSFGEVISHVAKTYAEVLWTVRHSDDAELRHEAWFHLGEVREGYAELVTALRAGRVRLPRGWSGVCRPPRS